MIYKDFIAEAAQKIMASVVAHKNSEGLRTDTVEMREYARGSVAAAKLLAEALDEDFNQEKVDGGIRRYAENETFFDNYVNWTKTK